MARRNRKLAGLVPQVPKSGYGLFGALLDCFSACSEDLAATLDRPHKNGGNPGCPARQMLRLNLLKFLLGERYANKFLDRVGNDPRLLELCGLSNVPSERTFSDFKNKKLDPHEEELDPILAIVAEDCAALIEETKESGVIPADAPALGETLAVDATDIPAYARARGEHCDPPGKEDCKKKHKIHCNSPAPEGCTERNHKPCPDPDAAWSYRTPKNKRPKAETGKGERFFGYSADVIIDAYYGLPLYINVRPANTNEGPRLREDLDAALKLHPWIKARYLTGDKGYHAGYNIRHIVSRRIIPVVAIPRPSEDEKGKRLYEGLYNEMGLPVCIGGKAMDFLGTEPDGRHLFRCPEGGCHLKGKTNWSRYCDFDHAEKPEGTKLRIMGVLHRASEEWQKIFKRRPAIERYFSSNKHSRLLDKHQFIGQKRVTLHDRMSTLSHLLTSWGRLRAGDYAHLRHMYIKLPKRPAPAAGPRESRKCDDCCLCPKHGLLAA